MENFEDITGDALRIETTRGTALEPGEVTLIAFERNEAPTVLYFTPEAADRIATALIEAARKARGEA